MKKAGRKKHMLLLMTLREIRSTFGRFFAVFAIIGIGTGFFSGVRITTPVMIHTVDDYYRASELYDYRVLSTLGWEADEVASIAAAPGVRSAEGAWQYDVLCTKEDGSTGVFKVHSLTEDVNHLQLREGHFPAGENECLIDDHNRMGLKVGDTISFSEANDPDTLDAFAGTSWTVAGFAESSLYINFERGTTSIGNGTVTGFMYLPKSAFTADYFTEIYVKLDSDTEIYSDEYSEQMDSLRPTFEDLVQTAADNRYDRLYDDAAGKLLDARKEFEDKKAEGEQELADAAAELEDGRKELDDAAAELDDGRKELDDAAAELHDGQKELEDAHSELSSGKQELDDSYKALVDARSRLEESRQQLLSARAELDAGGAQLSDAKAQLDAAKAELDAGKPELDAARAELASYAEQLTASRRQLDGAAAQLAAGKAALDENRAGLEAAKAQLDAGRAQVEALYGTDYYAPALAEYEQQKALYEGGLAAYEAGLAQYETSLAEYQAGEAAYAQGLAQYNAGKEAYEQAALRYSAGLAQYESGLAEYEANVTAYNQAVAQYEDGLRQYNEGLAKYMEGRGQYNQGLSEYASGAAAYTDALAEFESGKADYEQGKKDYEEGLKEYEDGLLEYEDGLREYEDAKQTFDEEIADAEQKLSDAEDELDDLEKPDTYLLERNTNIAYACFESDSQIVGQVARILPIFFILVAILVCMTTMTRMVDERRGQIGILKGLGYGRREIMMTFLAYSGTASALGCIIGYAGGVILFPSVIWYAYEMMYNGIQIHFLADWKLAAAVFLVALASTLGTTWLSCRNELEEPAASLMRPKAPKAGKRVFLEHFPAVWSRLRFMHKVSVRNIFRYKRRFFMMVVGIAGCTALLLTGFGIKDSIATFVDTQYADIQVSEVELITDEIPENELPADLSAAVKELDASYFLFRQSSWDLHTETRVKGVTVIAPDDWSEIDSFFRLKDMSGKPLHEAGPGEALISVSISQRYGLDAGDTIVLRNEDLETIEAVVAGVFENHVYNYVFLSKETIEHATGEYTINGAYVNFPDGTDVYEAQAVLAGLDSVVSASVFEDFRVRIANMMQSLNYVVLLIILSAAALAFVVLYNLTNINIMERLREIATIKVLGFYRRETSDYVFRENMLLTLIGMLAGLVLGVLLHGFVIDQIVVDLVYFRKEIKPISFVFSIILTFAFTFIVNQVMTLKLDRINMAESLKSVE